MRKYYARSNLNANKRDLKHPQRPKEEPELIRKIRKKDIENIRKYD